MLVQGVRRILPVGAESVNPLFLVLLVILFTPLHVERDNIRLSHACDFRDIFVGEVALQEIVDHWEKLWVDW